MMIFLPRNPKGLDTLLSTLSVTQVDTCAKQLEGRQIRLSIPKFKSESTYDLKPTLESLGMRDAFDSSKADFGGLPEVDARDHQLYITAAIHKAFVDVNEKGTEAAAATIVAFAPRSALVTKRPFIPEFTADRPFVYLIRDKATGLILFLGKMEQPA